MPKIKDDFGLSNPELGFLTTSFLWVYACSASLLGYVADRSTRKGVVIAGLIFWSLVCLLTPLASSYSAFLIAIAFTGFGEASYYPAGTALISSYHESDTRGNALSIHQTAVFAGGAVGTILAASLAEHCHWQTAYYVFGVFGIALASLLIPLLREQPSKYSSRLWTEPRATVGYVKRRWFVSSVLILCGLFTAGNFVTYSLTTWIPTYLFQSMHLTLAQAALYGTTVLNMATLAAVLIGGQVGDWARGRTLLGRYWMLTASLLAASACVALLNAAALSLNLTVCCLAGAGVFKGLFDANIYAAIHDVTHEDKRATAVGIVTTIGFSGAAIAPVLVGFASKHWGLGIALSLTAVAYTAGALLVPLNLRTLSEDLRDTRTEVSELAFNRVAP